MQVVPLAAVPSQNFAINLAGQAVAISLYLLGAGAAAALYMDLLLNGSPVFTARAARAYGGLPNTVARFMLDSKHYLGFLGDLIFIDTQASPTVPTEDPMPSGLGTRWQLLYVSESDLEGAGLVSS